jgi:hypothetical protein
MTNFQPRSRVPCPWSRPSHEHGWPDLDRYRKDPCLKAVRERLQGQYGEECWRLGL